MTTPITSTTYSVTSSQTEFDIGFSFVLQASFVKVSLNGTALTSPADYTVAVGGLSDGVYTTGTVTLTTAAVAGDSVTVSRDSGLSDSERLVNYEAGARLLESDLDKSAVQILHLLQEVRTTTAADILIADVTGLQTELDGKASTSTFGTSTTAGTSNDDGLVPGPSLSDVAGAYYLRADGAWGVPAGGGGGGGSTSFLGLSDTPASFTGYEGKFVKTSLKDAGVSMEFTDSIGPVSVMDDVSATQATEGDALVYDQLKKWIPSPSVKTSVGTTAASTFYGNGNLLVSDGTTYEPVIRSAADDTVLTAIAGGGLGWVAPAAAAGYSRGSIDTASFVGGASTSVTATVASTIRFDNTAADHYTSNAAQFTLEASKLSLGQPSVTDSAIQVTDAGVYLWTCKVSVLNTTLTALTTVAKSFRLQARYRSTDGIAVQPLLVSSHSSSTIEPQTYGTLTISYMANMNANSAMVFTVDPHDVLAGCPHQIQANTAQVTVQAL